MGKKQLPRSKAKPETMLRRLANDSKCPAKIRLRAIELIMVIEGSLRPEQVSQSDEVTSLAGMVRKEPANTRETFAGATAHGPQIDPANSIDH